MKAHPYYQDFRPRWRVSALTSAVSLALLIGLVCAFGEDGDCNFSYSPTESSEKAKLGFHASAYVDAASTDPVPQDVVPLGSPFDGVCEVSYSDTTGEVGLAQPLVVSYVEAGETHAAVSMDDGSVTWRAPERLTSDRRDAYQLSADFSSSGFALVWQEDPEGLQPGDAAGPRDGMSGATVSKKTDIWHSYLKMGDFAGTCEDCYPNGELDGFGEGKPKVATLFSSPVPSSLATQAIWASQASPLAETAVVSGNAESPRGLGSYAETGPVRGLFVCLNRYEGKLPQRGVDQ